MESLATMFAGLLFAAALAVVLIVVGWGVGTLIGELMWRLTKDNGRDDPL